MSQRVYAACAEVLMLAVSFPHAPSMGSAAELRQRLAGRARQHGRQGARGRHPRARPGRHALRGRGVLGRADPQVQLAGRNEWMSQPLQLVLFNQYTAGEHFFNRLRGLLGEGRADAIAAYQLCLALGFRGQFGTGGDPTSLAGFAQAALQQVSRSLPRSDKLGPHAIPADRANKVKTSNAPLIAFAAGGLVASPSACCSALERLVHGDVQKALDTLPQGALPQPASAPAR